MATQATHGTQAHGTPATHGTRAHGTQATHGTQAHGTQAHGTQDGHGFSSTQAIHAPGLHVALRLQPTCSNELAGVHQEVMHSLV